MKKGGIELWQKLHCLTLADTSRDLSFLSERFSINSLSLDPNNLPGWNTEAHMVFLDTPSATHGYNQTALHLVIEMTIYVADSLTPFSATLLFEA